MELENRIVCFIDILGFRDIINRFEETKDISIITKIKNAFESALKTITDFSSPENVKIIDISPEKIELLSKDLYYKTFSDNIIITLKYDQINESFLRKLSLLIIFSNIFQFEMHQKGVYMRGGISFGSFYKDDNIIFSTALVKAYELESKKSIYPRIMIDLELIDIIINAPKKSISEAGFSKLIYFDNQGDAFLSPFSPLDPLAWEIEEIFKTEFEEHDEIFQKIMNLLPDKIKSAARHPLQHLLSNYTFQLKNIFSKFNDVRLPKSVREKYSWLIEFYNWKYKDDSTISSFKTFNEHFKNIN